LGKRVTKRKTKSKRQTVDKKMSPRKPDRHKSFIDFRVIGFGYHGVGGTGWISSLFFRHIHMKREGIK
jgi:hypothetical protein